MGERERGEYGKIRKDKERDREREKSEKAGEKERRRERKGREEEVRKHMPSHKGQTFDNVILSILTKKRRGKSQVETDSSLTPASLQGSLYEVALPYIYSSEI